MRAFNLEPYVYEQSLSTHNLFARRPYPRPGQSAILDVVYPGKSQPFWLALSTDNWPGMPLRHVPYVGDQVLPLRAGPVLDLSLQARLMIQLDSTGHGSISLPIPQQSSLVGVRLYAVRIVRGGSSIDAISNDVLHRDPENAWEAWHGIVRACVQRPSQRCSWCSVGLPHGAGSETWQPATGRRRWIRRAGESLPRT